jgi:group II intron reverse transcriptase/maturase
MNNQTKFERICSDSNLQSSWERVYENHGCGGCDGISLLHFARNSTKYLKELKDDLGERRYCAFPLMRFPVKKRSVEGVRYLSVPTIRDRVAQTAVFLQTKDIFEKEFETVSHAYRLGRSVRTAIEEIQKWRDKGYCYAVDADIEAFFDNVDHKMLLEKLERISLDPEIMRLLQLWIKAEVYDGQRIWRLEKGIPQGSVVSPVLANLFLDELDEMLMSFNRKLVRYADDFLILCKSESEASENIELTDMILEEMHLDLNLLKTKIVSFDSGFKFLGAVFLFGDVYLPMPKKRQKNNEFRMPEPLTLKKYIELRYRERLI